MDLRNIDLNDPVVKRVVLIIFAGIGGAFLLSWFAIKPLYGEIESLESEYAGKRDRLTEIRQVTTNLASLEESVRDIERRRDSLQNMFFESANVPDLIGTLAKMAVEEGFLTSSFKPLPNQTISHEYYSGMVYEVVLRGGYHEIGRFIEKILGMDLIINISDLNLRTEPSLVSKLNNRDYMDSRQKNRSIESVLAEFKLVTYSINR
ncbi:type 4a pilus biogenesis protein PilO [Chitinivibrio alkaliphilus]|uniref:Pilus assembly protein PilO n=1 Tax=Chitinivibrio alkaliphilus ACht1 TaxID=1313304 RepID=U7D4P5_9BACT|nr:type 4a pilus biogenesis protein PilO [Chitinivibrio alkaliphilus]ERP30908.1 pilus assembly protein PilO [Chitinivibrio alkaliphilus ACht1]